MNYINLARKQLRVIYHLFISLVSNFVSVNAL